MASPPRVYKEGVLWKRARGLHNRRNIKWQERYCKLTDISLDYYDPKKLNEPKGQFKLEQINIVEIIAHGTFDKLKGHPFQIGDLIEVMYFAAKSPQERNEWMEVFRLAAIEKGNTLLSKHHPGVYGLTNKDRWSCCGRARKECEGCADSLGAMKMLRGNDTDVIKARSRTTISSFIGVGDESTGPTSDLSSSIKSDNSDTTLTDELEDSGVIRRTFTISSDNKPSGRSSIKSYSISSTSSSFPRSPTLSDTIEEISPISEESETGTNGTNTRPSSMLPPQIEDLTRSGASSPALSTDSGRGTSSRPRSMDTTEGDNVPSTPHSTRSNFTTATNESDKTEGVRKTVDTVSILSDTSGTSAFSGISQNPLTKRVVRTRPQSVIINNGIVMHVCDIPDTSGVMGEGMMKLHQGCKDGTLDIVKDEFDTGAPIGEQQLFNGVPMLPIFIAFLHDHRHIMLFLLEHGADPNALDMNSRSCLLHLASQKGCYEVAEMLIKYKADVNMRNHEDNTPLCEASKHGHKNIVELLINKLAIVSKSFMVLDSNRKAIVDFEGGANYTPLHYAAEAGHTDVVKLLINNGANLSKKSNNAQTPYQLAFQNNHSDIVELLQELLPVSQRPYKLIDSLDLPGGQLVSSLAFIGKEQLVTGSWDCMLRIWDIICGEFTSSHEIKLHNTVSGVSYHAPYILAGSTSVQVIDSRDYEWRRIIADDGSDDESLTDPPLHFVLYCPNSQMITAAVESNVIKIWPPTSKNSVVTKPDAVIKVHEKGEEGAISRICVSPNEDAPWLAVVLQPGQLLLPVKTKKVFIYNWKERKIYCILDTGKGGLTFNVEMTFSCDGHYLLVGCDNKLTKWQSETGDMERSIASLQTNDCIASLSCSCTGQIAVGLSNGDIKILNYETGVLLFTLRNKDDRSAVTSLQYSSDGTYFASGHSRGSLQLWESDMQECR